MAQVSFSLKCLEWSVFNFKTTLSSEEWRQMINLHPLSGGKLPTFGALKVKNASDIKINLLVFLNDLNGDWAMTENTAQVRVFIKEKSEAMMFKLAMSPDKLKFKNDYTFKLR